MIETSDMQFDSRMVTAEETPEDHDVEVTLRPQTLAEYIGQDKVKENMAIYIQAAKRRGDPLDHVLLYGPPGLGKTTLSAIIAHEMGVNLRVTTGPAIEKPGDLAALLTNLQPNDVLFIDEIHRLSRAVEEILYPALEDHAIDIIMGKGPSRPFSANRFEPVHADWCNDTSRAAFQSAARPIRCDSAVGALHHGTADGYCPAKQHDSGNSLYL